MNVEFVTITDENIHWALNENIKRALVAASYKVPNQGVWRLLGDLSFGDTHTIYNLAPAAPHTATSIENAP